MEHRDDDDSNNPLLLSLKSWPEVDTVDRSLASLITRIQVQRGNDFKGLSEDVLRKEIEEEEAGNTEQTIGEDGDGQNLPRGATFKELALPNDNASKESLATRRMELINTVELARQESIIALDFVSLLLSSTRPIVAEISMSKQLKDNIPMGTLGADRIKSRPLDRNADLKLVQGWKSEALKSASNSLLQAATRLNHEIDREVKYWDQILGIKNAGWAISRLPRDPKTLRVKYGFAEAGADYKDPGLGAMSKSADGTIYIEEVDHDAKSGQSVQVQIIRGGVVTGMSRLVLSENASNSVTEMIERARNSVYENELFFEIAREARTLANLGVRTSEDSVSIDFNENSFVQIEMRKNDTDENTIPSNKEDDILAQGISISLRILLSHAHRQNLKRRRDPPLPISQRRPPNLPLQILRPVAAHLHHREQLNSFDKFLAHLTSLPKVAGLPAKFSTRRCLNCFALEKVTDIDAAVGVFLDRLESDSIVHLPGNWKVTISVHTLLGAPVYGSRFIAHTSHDGSCATIMGTTTFGSFPEIKRYLQWCVERSIVSEIQSMKLNWAQIAMSNELSKAGERSQYKRLRVEVEGGSLDIKWNAGGGRDEMYSWNGTEGAKTLAEVLHDI